MCLWSGFSGILGAIAGAVLGDLRGVHTSHDPLGVSGEPRE